MSPFSILEKGKKKKKDRNPKKKEHKNKKKKCGKWKQGRWAPLPTSSNQGPDPVESYRGFLEPA